jgi:hypothetical protein
MISMRQDQNEPGHLSAGPGRLDISSLFTPCLLPLRFLCNVLPQTRRGQADSYWHEPQPLFRLLPEEPIASGDLGLRIDVRSLKTEGVLRGANVSPKSTGLLHDDGRAACGCPTLSALRHSLAEKSP